jgi:hypothetical protein
MIRHTSPTPVSGDRQRSHSVEELIKTLVREGSAPSSTVVVEHAVSIEKDEPGSDPYNHTGRFRKLFK